MWKERERDRTQPPGDAGVILKATEVLRCVLMGACSPNDPESYSNCHRNYEDTLGRPRQLSLQPG
ncbi:hypothetical protein E2C01_033133 [Portunus trituberculatus]|uniref:Uncharacterized protein n=1 Tax=Portunus trituberculatus TaxID=210409 RepID=A0A5B7EZC2_PORTR|nr:hypothetical protein [Portunus trituberculatus]